MNSSVNFNGIVHKQVHGGDMVSPLGLTLPNDFLV